MAILDQQQSDDGGGESPSRGVLLALAIVLLWLAGFCFFIALEGSKLLKESGKGDGPGLFRSMVGGIGQLVVDQQTRQAAAGGG